MQTPATLFSLGLTRKRLLLYIKGTGAIVTALLLAAWALKAYPAFHQQRVFRGIIAADLAEAGKLDLSYDEAVAYPDKAYRKHVVWCTQNLGKNGIFYKGDSSKRLFLSSGSAPMPPIGHRESCRKMLLELDGFRIDSNIPGVVYLYVRYLGNP